ncbi:MAG: RNA polymerase sigma factor [Candidatus Hinthialibacter antarcticus]|nr:RNA polymerase sigma factor [Candidatus Hinthialibacter antarcticus]
MNNLTDDQLVILCKTNNAAAGKELFVRYALFLYRLAYRTTLCKTTSEEISQEVWLKIFQNLNRYQEGSSFKSWSASICYNLCVDHIRRSQRQKNLDVNLLTQLLYPAQLIPIHYAEQNEWLEKIIQHIQDMPEAFRTAFSLRYLEDMKYQEIAEIMNCQVKTARTRVFRVTESLREQFSV